MKSASKAFAGIKITRIQAFKVDLPLHEQSYKWSGGKSVDVFDATVVKIETNAGITGYGMRTCSVLSSFHFSLKLVVNME